MRRVALIALVALAACRCGSEHNPRGDASPTVPVILSPAAGLALGAADLVAGQTPFAGAAEAGAAVEVEVDGVLACSTTARADGTWFAAATVSDGTHAARARARDASGNASAFSIPVAFTVDRIPPSAPAIAAPADGTLTNAPAVVVSGTAPLDAVAVRIFDASALATTAGAAAGAFAATLYPAEGGHVLTAFAVDAAGNVSSSSSSVTLTVNRTAPAVPTLAAPAAGALVTLADLVAGQVAFAGGAAAGVTVEVVVDGVLIASVLATPGGAWSAAAALSAGGHVAELQARDAAGNVSGPTAPVPFTVDLARQAAPLADAGPVPVTTWGQAIPDAMGLPLSEVFPGQANNWVLDRDFSLSQGFGLQFSNALVLYVGTTAAPQTHDVLFDAILQGRIAPFPSDQTAAGATYLTPRFSTADGLVTAASDDATIANLPPPLSGTRSGYLAGTSSSSLAQTIPVSCASSCSFGWAHGAALYDGELLGARVAPYRADYRVLLRDGVSGAQIGEPLFVATTAAFDAVPVSTTRSGLPPQVVLSFELRGASGSYVQLDDVTVSDDTGPVALANPGFESGLAPWAPGAGSEVQNVRSAPRDVATASSALRITRTFYAPPAATWGRMVDVFENTGATAIATQAVYMVNLSGGLPSAAVTQGGAAVVGWDTSGVSRDVGLVLGTGAAFVAPGDPYVFVVHELMVPAGGKVAVVHFVVQLGDATAASTVPPATDAECGAILAGFRTIEAYRLDLEPGILQLIQNL